MTRTADAAGSVLGLREQIGGGEGGRHAAVGDDHHLGRPGERVDADRARDLALGQRDVAVAGADDDVDRADGLGAVGERGDRLRTADAVHLGDTGQRGRRQRGRGHGAVGGRRDAEDHLVDAGELRRDRGHQHGRRVRGATAGHVADRRARPGSPAPASDDAVAFEHRLGRVELGGVVLADAVGGDLERGAELGRGGVERGAQRRRRGPGGRRGRTRRTAP